jgi:hypothetical protein
VSLDRYLEPPEPIAEREEDAWCDRCEKDTPHLWQRWAYNTATRECEECGDVTEIEDDE